MFQSIWGMAEDSINPGLLAKNGLIQHEEIGGPEQHYEWLSSWGFEAKLPRILRASSATHTLCDLCLHLFGCRMGRITVPIA